MKKRFLILLIMLLSLFMTACIKVELAKPGEHEQPVQEESSQMETPPATEEETLLEEECIQETNVKTEVVREETNPVVMQGTCGSDATWAVDENGHLTISGSGTMYGGWRIADEMTRNGGSAWASEIYCIEVQEGITEIGEAAFRFCNKAEEVILHEGLEKIGAGAFWGCGFQEILLPDSLLEIGEAAFYETGLVSVRVPRAVEKVGMSAFRSKSLEKIYVDSENEHYMSLEGCLYSKDQTVLVQYPCCYRGVAQIADGTQIIAKEAFADCRFVTQVNIPSSVTNIAAGAFYNCLQMKSIEVSGNPHYKIIDGMLYHSPSMTLVYCPDGAANDVKIPNGTRIIGAYALQDSALFSVWIPASVEVIEEEAFGWNLDVPIHYDGTWESWQKIDIRDPQVYSVSVYTK